MFKFNVLKLGAFLFICFAVSLISAAPFVIIVLALAPVPLVASGTFATFFANENHGRQQLFGYSWYLLNKISLWLVRRVFSAAGWYIYVRSNHSGTTATGPYWSIVALERGSDIAVTNKDEAYGGFHFQKPEGVKIGPPIEEYYRPGLI